MSVAVKPGQTMRAHGLTTRATHLLEALYALFARIPRGLISLLARVSIAFTFWLSGQTKVEGLVLDPIGRNIQLGWPHLSESAIDLFRYEYALPLIPPDLAALMAATTEHVLPLLLLAGLATRLSAFALLVMTLVIQVFVYPGAFPTHGTWAVALLYLMMRGPGPLSLDGLLTRYFGASHGRPAVPGN